MAAASREVAQRISAALARREDITDEMARLSALMEQAAAAAAEASSLQESWRQAGRTASPQLKAAVDSHTRVLRELIDLVQQSEQAALSARDALRPQLDNAARDRKAIDRYGQAAKL